jgi:uncharacterized protein YggE
MRTLLALITLGVAAPLAFAQLDSNSVTVTAARNANLQSDQAVFAVAVDTPLDVSLNDVVAALQGAGITLSNFAGVRSSGSFIGIPVTPPQPPPQVEWTFGLPVAISRLSETATQLNTVQQGVVKNNKGWTMSFSVQGTQVSLPLQQSQTCSVADLIADARTQAQKLATAAGMNVGNVLAMMSSTSTTLPGGGVYIGQGINLSFPTGSSFFGPQLCSATVKFALK